VYELTLQSDTITSPVLITDHEAKTKIQINEIHPDSPYMLLGVQIYTDGNNEAQVRAIRDKCEKMANAFARCNLSVEDTKQGYHSIFLPGVGYGVATMTTPINKLHDAQKIATGIVLPKNRL
jgi:hypothetical protein